MKREKESYDISERADNCLNNPETRARVRTKTCPLFQPPVWMPLASPATPARNRRARLASQPHLAWLFALQGANQNLSAFSIACLDAARISRDPSKKSPCTTCIPTASGLAFRSPGCEPKPVRFSSPESRDILSGHEPGCPYTRSLSRLLPGSSDGLRE